MILYYGLTLLINRIKKNQDCNLYRHNDNSIYHNLLNYKNKKIDSTLCKKSLLYFSRI